MRITVTLTPEAKSILKNLPITSQSAINNCLQRLERSISLPDEIALNNTGYRCLVVPPNGELILFTREETKAWLTQETIYRVNIIKITKGDYFAGFVKDRLIPEPKAPPPLESSSLTQLKQMGTDSLDQAGRFGVLSQLIPILIGLVITVLLNADALDFKNKHQPENSTHSYQSSFKYKKLLSKIPQNFRFF